MLVQVDAYDEVMRAYYAGRGAAGRDWSTGIAQRYESGRRGYLAGYYNRKGARLTGDS